MRPLFRRRRSMDFEQAQTKTQTFEQGQGQRSIAPTHKLVSPKRQYKLNRRQKNRLKRWQTPDHNPNANSIASRVMAGLPLRF